MAKLKVDGKEIEVPDHFTLLQAAEEAGAEVPRFCFHERLSIAGNCRMCLIEVKGGPPKPAASCAMGVRDLRPGPNGEPPEIFTNTPMVKKAREGVMEFLLINHPLDCPICDQGGECDLQDQAMAFGVDSSRYQENKRAVEDKYIGPLVKTIMNRCIHCTRCVRFTTEVAGISELGLIGRGEDAEITTYLEQAMTSELQGNVIDLCPVGALTSKPYAFQARPWELTKTESIDVMDAVGSAIRVDSRGREVMRILPRVNEAVNEEWISDKTRFIWDGLRSQRLDRPYVRQGRQAAPASWPEAFAAIRDAVARTAPDRIGAIAGDLAAVEEMYALKLLMQSLGSKNIDCRQDGAALDPKHGRASYIFNPTIEGIERADAMLIIGANPRFEASVLNARIRKRWRAGNVPVGVDRRCRRHALRLSDARRRRRNRCSDLADGAGRLLRGAEEGRASADHRRAGRASRGPTARAVLGLAAKLAQAVDAVDGRLERLCRAAHRGRPRRRPRHRLRAGDAAARTSPACSAATRRAVPARRRRARPVQGRRNAFVVYIGTHGDAGAHRANVILPAAAYTEKSGTYVNTEGRVQMTNRAGFAPGEAREDWAILRALSDVLGKRCRSIRWRSCAASSMRDYPHLGRDRPDRAGRRRPISAGWRRSAASSARPPSSRRSRISTSPTRSRAPPPSWPNAPRWRARASSRRPSRNRHGQLLLHLRPAGPDHPAEVGRADRRPADLRRLHPLRRPQDLGGRAAAPRPQRGRPLGACCRPSPTC